jgi:acyl carrier protein
MEQKKLKRIISQILSVDITEINEQTSFTDDLGADSLDLYQIALEVEKEFDIIIDESAMHINTFSQAMNLICREAKGRSNES